MPLAAMSSSCVPISAILPASTRKMRSEFLRVLRRWAMAMVVRPSVMRLSASWMSFSLSVSTELGGLVQHEDPRIVEQRPGDGDPLTLPAGEPRAPLADVGVVSQGVPRDEVVAVGRLGRGDHAVGRGLAQAVGQVVVNGPAEQEGLLEDHADLPAQVAGVDLADVQAVDQDSPLVHVVEAGQEVDDRRLARAALAHDADPLARLDPETDALENRLVAVVAEGHVLEDDPAFDRLQALASSAWAIWTGVSRISNVRCVAVRKPVSQLVSCVRLVRGW